MTTSRSEDAWFSSEVAPYQKLSSSSVVVVAGEASKSSDNEIGTSSSSSAEYHYTPPAIPAPIPIPETSSNPVSSPKVETTISIHNSQPLTESPLVASESATDSLTKRSSDSTLSADSETQPPSGSASPTPQTPGDILSQLESAYPGILTYFGESSSGSGSSSVATTSKAKGQPVEVVTRTVYPGASSSATKSVKSSVVQAQSQASIPASLAASTPAIKTTVRPTSTPVVSSAGPWSSKWSSAWSSQWTFPVLASASSVPRSSDDLIQTVIGSSGSLSASNSFASALSSTTTTAPSVPVPVPSSSGAWTQGGVSSPLSWSPAASSSSPSSSLSGIKSYIQSSSAAIVLPTSSFASLSSSATPTSSFVLIQSSSSVSSTPLVSSTTSTTSGYLVPVPSSTIASPVVMSSAISHSSHGSSSVVIIAPGTSSSTVSTTSTASVVTQAPATSAATTPVASSSSNWLPAVLITETPSPSPTGQASSPQSGTGHAETPSSSQSTALPTNYPQAITPGGVPGNTPDGYERIQIGFQYQLNYPFVVSNPLAAAQIYQYLPKGLSHGLNAPIKQMQMVQLEPYSMAGISYVVTLAIVDIPKSLVSTLNAQIHTPTSQLYEYPNDAGVKSLMNLIDPSIPLIPDGSSTNNNGGQAFGQPANSAGGADGSGSSGSGQNGNGNSGNSQGSNSGSNNAGTSSPDNGSLDSSGPQTSSAKVDSKNVGIVLGSIGGAAAYLGVAFLFLRRYRQAKKPQVSVGAAQRAVAGTGTGVLALAAGRGSPMSQHYYDDASSFDSTASSGNRRHPGIGTMLPVGQPRISEPVLSQNSLGWA